MSGPFVSVVVTTLNEGKHMRDLLDSLVLQEGPFEVLIVDAGSTDGTIAIVSEFQKRFPAIVRLLKSPGRRGASRNYGVQQSRGEFIAFTDGDCIANAFWLRNLRHQARPDRIVAGRSVRIGYWAFDLGRVELERRGYDITFPSSNLLYPREAFLRIGGFDPRFVTAEDIDLNFRAVEAGLGIHYQDDAVVYARARESITSFLRQAFWNGYGRKQLTLKHGNLWTEYSFARMLRGQLHLWGILRLAMAVIGYVRCKLAEDPRDWAAAPRSSSTTVTA